VLALSLVLGGDFFFGYLELRQLLDGGCFYEDMTDSLE
jgi:hypothetical protein